MGIPSYFSHLVKEHSEIIKEVLTFLSSIDNLYLDSNSIIYDNFYKIADEPCDKETFETKLLENICTTIEKYILTIKPEKTVIIAFDGVAPIAKLEQQRNRRYKSQFEKALFKQMQIDNIEKDTWDQTAITPGTTFMKKLGFYVNNYFEKNKSKFAAKQIIISDTDVAGEGEHKIFEYIRNHKEKHETETTIIYGLDADLIMLSLNHTSICKNIYLYRETPHFIKNINSSLEPSKEYILDISELGKKICENMKNYRNVTSQQKVNTMHDYILLCFFLGNDFMPHIPAINIRTSGIDILMNAYKETIGNTNQNLTDGKKIEWKNVQKIIKYLSEKERKNLKKEFIIRRRWEKRDYPISSIDDIKKKFLSIPTRERMTEEYINPFESGWDTRYYRALFNFEYNENDIKNVCINYLECLEWTFKYYNSCCYDWRWCYKYNYAPLLKDLIKYIPYFDTEFVDLKEKLPIHPIVQLSYVLPKKSLHLLPEKIKHKLVTEKNEWYNDNCNFQWAFCKYFWESHVILPEINVNEIEKLVLG